MRTGLTKREKTTDIWFDEKDPLIHIRTHNTALKKRTSCTQIDNEVLDALTEVAGHAG